MLLLRVPSSHEIVLAASHFLEGIYSGESVDDQHRAVNVSAFELPIEKGTMLNIRKKLDVQYDKQTPQAYPQCHTLQ